MQDGINILKNISKIRTLNQMESKVIEFSPVSISVNIFPFEFSFLWIFIWIFVVFRPLAVFHNNPPYWKSTWKFNISIFKDTEPFIIDCSVDLEGRVMKKGSSLDSQEVLEIL
jgi:hypothetical protein